MNKYILLTLAFLFFIPSFSPAQQHQFYGSGKLSSNLIISITQDSSGFIWIGTENGLNKFDGWKFTPYFRNEKDSTSLVGNYVEAFLTDKEGTLWIGTNRGIQYYCPYKDVFYTVTFPGNITPSVKDIIQTHTGELWITTAGYGMFAVDKPTLRAKRLNKLNEMLGNPYAGALFEDRAHQLWIALSGNRMACVSPDRKSVRTYNLPIDPRRKVHGITEDFMGRIFIATSSMVFLWDNIRQEYIQIKSDEGIADIRGIACLKDGTVYVHTIGQGLKYIDTNTMRLVTPAKLPNGYNNPVQERMSAFFEDKNGNFWMGCYKKGVMVVLNEPALFEFWNIPKMEGEIFSIHEDRENYIWVGTRVGLLIKMDDKGNILHTFHLPKDISCIYEDKLGNFWLGSHQGGLFTFDKKSGAYSTFPAMEGKSVIEISEDNHHNLYLSVLGEGFARYNPVSGEWLSISAETPMKDSRSLRNNWVGEILCDSDGLIWMSLSTGVDCYDPERNVFVDFPANIRFPTCSTYVLEEDDRKNIWIGTDSGLFQYNKERKELNHYGMDEGLPSNIIYGLGIDSKQNVWGSTLNGLFRMNEGNKRIASYFSGNGLVDKEYSNGIYIQDRKGYIYFGGVNGITRFIPDSIKPRQMDYTPVLTRLYVNNLAVSADKRLNSKPVAEVDFIDAGTIHLSHNEKSFTLEFSTMNFHNPENIIFEYRLPGMNEQWSSTFPGENRITYNFLAPGNYTLEVRAFENNTYSSVKSLGIHITPPWYQTVWAMLLYALLFVGAMSGTGYTFYKRQHRRQEERNNEEKLKFFINIAHELRSPITLIVSPLSELMKQTQDENTLKLLHTMQRNTNRIMNLINQLLDIRKIDKGQMKMMYEETDLVDFIRELVRSFDYQATKRNIFFTFESDMEHLPVWIDRNNFDKILMNLMINAFKYTQNGGEIMILLTILKEPVVLDKTLPPMACAEIRVIDSGTGLNTKEIERIFERFYQVSSHSLSGFGIGLNLTKTLVELHHGTIHAANRTNTQGSCFTVRIPLGKAHLSPDEISGEKSTQRIALQTPLYWEEKGTETSTVKNKTRKRVLVVDDDEEVREYLQNELSQLYKVTTANNGAEALQVLLRQRIDLVISDVKMPEMDGFTLLRKIKGNTNISHVPVILLTSQVEFHNRMKGWDVGADGFIDKPFHIEELLRLCDNLITNRSLLKGKFVGIKEMEDKMTGVEMKSNDEQFIERLMNLINRNIDNSNFSVEILAKEAGISRTQLHRKLKEMAGITTSDFIRNIRLKQAAKLLMEKKVNISQVAYATGFTNPTVFAVAFKKFYGCTPSEYAEKDRTAGEGEE